MKAQRATQEGNQYDEVWDGVTVIMPLPNDEHQDSVSELCFVFRAVTNRPAGDVVRPGINLSDRGTDWMQNFREPDVAVILAGNPTIDHGTHWKGGPDLVVEVLSPGDRGRDKLPFYAAVGTREALVIDRDPWQLELYQLAGGVLAPAGTSSIAAPAVLTSGVLPLTFRLVAGQPRPQIEVTHATTG